MPITQDYAQHLKRKNLQENSIASYISDIQLFIRWRETNAPLGTFSTEIVNQYLKTASFTRSPETMKRKEVSLANFIKWVNENEKSSNTYTNNSIGKYLTVLALIIVCMQILLPTQNNLEDGTVLSDSIDNPLSANTSVVETSTNFNNVKIPIAVSGYEISPDVSAYYPSSEKSMVLALQDESAVDDENQHSVVLSPVGGTELIEAGNLHTIIYSSSIKQNSIITVTPTASTNGQTLYIKDQKEGIAVIAIDQAIDKPLPFNWIVLQ